MLRLIGGAVVIVGFLSDALGEAVDGYLAWGGAHTGMPIAPEAKLFGLLDNSTAALPLSWLAIPIAVVGALILGVGLVRAHRVIPVWASIVFLAGAVLAAVFPEGITALTGIVFIVGAIAVAVLAARTARADA